MPQLAERLLLGADELKDWKDSFDDVASRVGLDQAAQLLQAVAQHAVTRDVQPGTLMHTPYVNTIDLADQPEYPGDEAIERRLRNYVRWNAMAMVVRANRERPGIGGHISTVSSIVTLYEVAQNHFFHAPTDTHTGDFVYFQGHASPGNYARAFLEGRLSDRDLFNYRREANAERGLPSYPHPLLMPDFWQFPTVSMGLGPLTSIYHARFLRYLHHRDILDTSASRVWCFAGDGEMDEPEATAGLAMAAREQLDNLTFVVDCNLQRLDGPVRGNGKVIQELEGIFRGAGWNVVKALWGSDWDEVFAADHHGLLTQRLNELVDGQLQKYAASSGDYIRQDFFGRSPELLAMVQHLSDEQIRRLSRGGHDVKKIYAAYDAAVHHTKGPTVVLAQTIKGYGQGSAGEASNVAHQQHDFSEEQLFKFRERFQLPLSDEDIRNVALFRPSDESQELQYLHKQREKLGGYLPARTPSTATLEVPELETFESQLEGSDERKQATTMAMGRLLATLLRDENLGKRIVPIIPDEARTFGLQPLFAQYGIYASGGQLYEPVDAGKVMCYRESRDGQILEEGINEAGALASFIAAGTSGVNLQMPMIPMYFFYSMFGFQRVGDLIWAAADAGAKGFLLGCTAGRTTLQNEGLQHCDGHSPLIATTVPTLQSYDPAFAYEVAVIVRDGLRRMYVKNESVFYYLTLYNESYAMPAMPDDCAEGIRRGMHLIRRSGIVDSEASTRPQLFGSGPMVPETLRAQTILAEQFGVASDVWSVTSYSRLRRDSLEADRHNRLHPGQPTERSFLQQSLHGLGGPFIAVTDYVRLIPDQIREWVPGRYITLGTDGFGRSDTRTELRRYFAISAEHIAYSTLHALAEQSKFDQNQLPTALQILNIDCVSANHDGSTHESSH